ncbi:MAG: PA2778 family cysteine peptidase [Gammaproteobacteria bacterium]|nr:PA2778 family cysteine peptidase [Gammaproteobacteria bacterium]
MILRFARPLLLPLAMLAGGCAGNVLQGDADLPLSVEWQETPFFPQEEYQCGPAALATLLSSSGRSVRPEELVARVYVPGKRGSFQSELLAATRSYERMPYVIPPQISALLAELADGRTVLVFQNLGARLLPVWHYAVVIGFSLEKDRIILRSGTSKRLELSARRFLRTWERGESWGMVALAPGELPATGGESRYVKAVAATESSGHPDLAIPAYQAALDRWPDSATALFGLGNSFFKSGNFGQSERSYRKLLQTDPDHTATRNNLAQMLADQGRCREARQIIDEALSRSDPEPWLAEALADTSEQISSCR